MRRYCYFCDKKVESEFEDRNVNLNINGIDVNYIAHIIKCSDCGNEIDGGAIDDENIEEAHKVYIRRKNIDSKNS